jgi:hypothetical protein
LRQLLTLIVILVAFAAPPAALAVPPTLLSLGHQARHPTASFSAHNADFVTIYFATRPDRATDGNFLTEHVKYTDPLTDSEIQQGRWLRASRIEPGTYWVMLRASPDFDRCYRSDTGDYDPACAQGYSEPVRWVLPRPQSRFSVSLYRWQSRPRIDLNFAARPWGDKTPVRLCYRTAAKQRRCLNGMLDGFTWDVGSSDEISVSTRGLATWTTFEWFLEGKRVLQRRIRVR